MKQINDICEDIRNETFWPKITDRNSHFNSFHNEKTDREMMDRLLIEDHSVSSFSSDEDMREMIIEAMINKHNTIEKALKKVKDKTPLAFEYTFNDSLYKNPNDPYDYETHHKGFYRNKKTNRILEKSTNEVRIVFQKNSKSEYGFTLLTAYPNIDSKNAKETNRDLTDVLKNSNRYKKASNLKKLFLEESLTNKSLIEYEKLPIEKINISTKEKKNEKYMITIENDKSYISKYKKENNKWMAQPSFISRKDFVCYDGVNLKSNLEKSEIRKLAQNNFKKEFKIYENIKSKIKKEKPLDLTKTVFKEKEKEQELEY